MYRFVAVASETVTEEQRHLPDRNIFYDRIDEDASSTQNENLKKCTDCNKLYPNSKRKCEICKVDLPNEKDVVLATRKRKAESQIRPAINKESLF